MMTDNRVQPIFFPPAPLKKSGPKGSVPVGKKVTGSEDNFAQLLQKSKTGKELRFSAHARRRMEARSMALGAEEIGKLNQAVEKAAAKGCRSSLLLYGEMAFVAGVANRTIITALDGDSMKEHVFTNIDSAVVIE